MTLQENVQLEHYTTLQTPAVARFFVSATSISEATEVVAYAQQEDLPLFILGGGSNIVVSHDWPGVVLHVQLTGINIVSEDDKTVELSVGAGENWHELVTTTVANEWYGLENLALIPGTVGAAPVQNIGAYGVEIADLITAVEAIDIERGEVQTFTPSECQFGYRTSIFRGHVPNKYLITAVHFRLHKDATQTTVAYPALQQALEENDRDIETVDPQTVMNTVIDIRKSKLPDPREVPNVGSFFKNPIVAQDQFQQLQERYPNMPSYDVEGGHKIPASWLIETAGFKGKIEDGLGMSPSHALVLINPGHNPGSAILAFAATVQETIAEQFGIQLEMEPIVL